METVQSLQSPCCQCRHDVLMNIGPFVIAGSDPEIDCSFQNVPAKTDLRDKFRGGHPEKIAI